MRFDRTLTALGTLLACLAMVSPVQAELNAYLRMQGQKSGDVKGSVIQKGREDSIMVIAMSHEIVSPRDPQSGLPTGKRQHKPLVITKEVDRSTPILRNILVNNENVSTLTLEFWRPSVKGGATGTGAEEKYLIVKLTNANIASIRQVMLNNKDPNLMRFAQYEEIAFTYQKIEWTYVDGGVTASDTWEAPAS